MTRGEIEALVARERPGWRVVDVVEVADQCCRPRVRPGDGAAPLSEAERAPAARRAASCGDAPLRSVPGPPPPHRFACAR